MSIAVPSAALPGTGSAVRRDQSVARIARRSKSRPSPPAPCDKPPFPLATAARVSPQPRLGMGRHGSVFARSSRAGAPAEAIKILPAGAACLRELWALNEVCMHPVVVEVRRATVLRAGGTGQTSSRAGSGPVATVELALELCAGGDLLQRLQASPSAVNRARRSSSHRHGSPSAATGAGAADEAPQAAGRAAASADSAAAAAPADARGALPASTSAASRESSAAAAAADCAGETPSTVGGRLTECECRNVMAGIAAALSLCHARGVAHGDLKPENVLLPAVSAPVASVMSVRLCDFTAACPVGVRSGRECAASAEYAAPEAARACRLCAATGPRGASARRQAAEASQGRGASPTRSPASSSAGSPAAARPAMAGSPSSRAAVAAGPAWFASDAADVWSLASLGLTLLLGRSPFRFETAPPGQAASDPQMSFGSDDDLDGSHSASLPSLACPSQAATAASMQLYADLEAAWALEDDGLAHTSAQAAVSRAVESGGSSLSGSAAHFFASLLHPEPARRPTAASACRHPWIAGLLVEGDSAGSFLPAGEPLRYAAQARASLDQAARQLAAPKHAHSPANPRLRVSQSEAAQARPESPVAALTAKLGRALSFGDDVTPPPALTLRARIGSATAQAAADPPSPMRGSSGRKRSVSHREAKSPAQSPRGFAGVPRLAREFPLPFAVSPAAAAQAAMRLGAQPAAAATHQPSSSSTSHCEALDGAAVLHTLPSLASPVSTASDNGSEAPPSLTLSRGPGSPPPKRVHRPLKGADG